MNQKRRLQKFKYSKTRDIWDTQDSVAINNACHKKQVYVSERVAQEHAEICTELHGKTFRVYKCNYCKQYHLTTQEKYEPRNKNRNLQVKVGSQDSS